jgi:hypothetical protein
MKNPSYGSQSLAVMSVVVALADNSWLWRMTAEAIVVALEGGGGLRRDGGGGRARCRPYSSYHRDQRVIPPMMVIAITPPLMNAVTLQFSTGGDEDDCHKEGKEGSAAVMIISPSPTTGTGVTPTLMTENFYLY